MEPIYSDYLPSALQREARTQPVIDRWERIYANAPSISQIQVNSPAEPRGALDTSERIDSTELTQGDASDAKSREKLDEPTENPERSDLRVPSNEKSPGHCGFEAQCSQSTDSAAASDGTQLWNDAQLANSAATWRRNDNDQASDRVLSLDTSTIAPLIGFAEAPKGSAPSAGDCSDLAELLAAYVRQLLISEASAGSDARIMLALDESILPQTQLFLTKTAKGWVLSATTRSLDAERTVHSNRLALIERFSQKRLGELAIQITRVS
jgi:hypothetical protein